MTTWHIIYHGGDRSVISVLELDECMKYELSDYALASRREFTALQDAEEYAIDLGITHSVKFLSDKPDYLD